MNVWRASQRLVTWAWSKNSQIWRSERKITLIINNWTAHLHVEKLKWVEMIFLLPDTISHTQPMDQGIIRALEAKYCSLVVRKLILSIQCQNFPFFQWCICWKKHGCYLVPDIHQLLQKIGNRAEWYWKGNEWRRGSF